MVKKPGSRVRGSTTGRPLMVLLDVLGQRWTLRILWELRNEPLTFRELRSRCDDMSPTLLNHRLKELRELKLVHRESDGYTLSDWGHNIGEPLNQLEKLSWEWAKAVD